MREHLAVPPEGLVEIFKARTPPPPRQYWIVAYDPIHDVWDLIDDISTLSNANKWMQGIVKEWSPGYTSLAIWDTHNNAIATLDDGSKAYWEVTTK